VGIAANRRKCRFSRGGSEGPFVFKGGVTNYGGTVTALGDSRSVEESRNEKKNAILRFRRGGGEKERKRTGDGGGGKKSFMPIVEGENEERT